MSKVSGVVKALMSRPWQNKEFHSFRLENDDRIFNTGTRKIPSIVVGTAVSFNVDQNAKGYWDVDTKSVEQIQVVKQEPIQQPFKDKEAKAAYWETKDKVVELQACRNTAVELVKVLLANEAIKIPAKANKYDVITEYVSTLTKEFIEANERIRRGEVEEPNEEVGDTTQEEPATDLAGQPNQDDWSE